MYSPLTIAKKLDHLISYTVSGQPQPEEVQEEIMHMLANLHRVFPRWVICTCRFRHSNFFYLSDNCRSVLGLEPEILASSLQIEHYAKRLHPADADDLAKCMQVMAELAGREKPEDQHKLRFVLNYRIQHADRGYIHLHDEKAMLLLKDNRHLYYMLLKDISEEVPFSGVKMAVYKDGCDGKIFEYNASMEAALRLTPRENEMIPLMRQGLSVKEIARHLGISPNTVRNIRQKMFERFSVNNVIELLNITGAIAEKGSQAVITPTV